MHARPVREQWGFGLYDTNKKVGHIELVENRSSETLIPLIQRYCLPGTIIISDGWAGYNRLSEYGFEHRVVIHKNYFVDHETGVHTNNVENYWMRCKKKFKQIFGTKFHLIPSYLDEFMWNERYEFGFKKRWMNILNDIKIHEN